MGLLDHIVVLFLLFLEASRLFSLAVEWFYHSSSPAQGFQFLHVLIFDRRNIFFNICYKLICPHYHPRSYVKILTSNVTGFADGDFGRNVGLNEVTRARIHDGIITEEEETPENLFSFSLPMDTHTHTHTHTKGCMWACSKMAAVFKTENEPSSESDHDLRLPASRHVRK